MLVAVEGLTTLHVIVVVSNIFRSWLVSNIFRSFSSLDALLFYGSCIPSEGTGQKFWWPDILLLHQNDSSTTTARESTLWYLWSGWSLLALPAKSPACRECPSLFLAGNNRLSTPLPAPCPLPTAHWNIEARICPSKSQPIIWGHKLFSEALTYIFVIVHSQGHFYACREEKTAIP